MGVAMVLQSDKKAGASDVETRHVLDEAPQTEITIRTPIGAPKVRITIEIESDALTALRLSSDDDVDAEITAAPTLASGRKLPPLAFVTSRQRLAANIGQTAARTVFDMIGRAGQTLIDIDGAADIMDVVHKGASKAHGVVLVGGYDVIPSLRFDVLPAELRASIPDTTEDADDFVVWSDQAFADLDGDGLADVPISRIPDAKSATLVLKQLTTPAHAPRFGRFGIRNVARPFAEAIYELMTGSEGLLVSKPTLAKSISSPSVDSSLVYFMLHGDYNDCTTFWGEDGGDYPRAFHLDAVPSSVGAVVFAGCCWGALTVEETARRATGRPTPLPPSRSIALKFLENGARAFIGCTGTHYSPEPGEPSYFGGPMHFAFWRSIAAGKAPAEALFEAKVDYIRGMPHGRQQPIERAIEFKILRQFTCLGLGW